MEGRERVRRSFLVSAERSGEESFVSPAAEAVGLLIDGEAREERDEKKSFPP